MKTAYVCSGGSIRGAFQVGVIKRLAELNIKPDYLYGISVGSLNTTLYNHQSYYAHDLQSVARAVENFWVNNITCPDKIIKKRGYLSLISSIVQGKFNGLVDTEPLKKLISDRIDFNKLRIPQKVGAVNFRTGKTEYSTPQDDGFKDYVLASTAIPVSMPGVKILNDIYFDGGVRDIAPLKTAIDEGCECIYVILCQPEIIGHSERNPGNIIHLAERITDIMCNEIVNNDIATCIRQNDNPDKKKIELHVIRPEAEINVDILNFTTQDIRYMISLGYQVAYDTIK